MNIYIMGLGALGSNLMIQLAQKYSQFSFYGIDHDVVEERNIATQQYLIPHIGMPKADAMRIVFGLKIRKAHYTSKNVFIEHTDDIDYITGMPIDYKNTLIIDCFDNTKSRQILKNYDKKVNMLHIGFSPQYTAEIIWDEDYSVPNDIPADQNDICEMSEAVPFINFVVSLACMTVSDFFNTSIKKSLIVTDKNRILKLN